MLPSIYPSDPLLQGAQIFRQLAGELVKRMRGYVREEVLLGAAMLYEHKVIQAVYQGHLEWPPKPPITASVS
jgi:hypothetical protein